jgi:polyisoprenoid-binding protein YceI
MKIRSIFTLSLAVLALITMSFVTPQQEEGTAPADKLAESNIVWKGYKVTGSHTGTINLKSGDLKFENGQLKGGTFTVDMTSLVVTDLTGGYKDKLEGHLKSEDFFGIEKHPTANFVITKVAPQGTPGDYKVTGDLTIKGITKPIKFFTNVKEENGKRVAVAEIKVDRSEYNVRYGSGSFFDNLGDNTIYDEFDLEVTLVSNK